MVKCSSDINNLPEPVQNYIERSRSYYSDGDEVTQAMVEAKLRKIISDAEENNLLESRDWDNYEIPVYVSIRIVTLIL